MVSDYSRFMKLALEEAEKGYGSGEVPVGALLIGRDGEIIARDHNRSIALSDPTGHAEVLVLRSAGKILNNYRLTDTTLIVTIEPCIMCIGAAIQARVGRLVYGAPDPKAGAAGSVFSLAYDSRLNHRMDVLPGIMQDECSNILKQFFQERRNKE